LAQRLDGFPLALATAGAFLKQSTLGILEYLELYNAQWDRVTRIQLPDYTTHTQYTTWDLSFEQVQQVHLEAAQLLAFLAYLDHQDFWFGLFAVDRQTTTSLSWKKLIHGRRKRRPPWFINLTKDELSFEKAMATLVRYCLVEMHHQTRSYSLHACVHDWTLNGLNRNVDAVQYWLAFDCLASHVEVEDWESLSTLRYRRFAPHVARLEHSRFQTVASQQRLTPNQVNQVEVFAKLLRQQIMHSAAEKMYRRALAEQKKALGPEHTSTLITVNDLGNLYRDQGKLADAEAMYRRALAGREKALGPEHTSTLNTINNMGTLLCLQGQLSEAESMYQYASSGTKRALGPDHFNVLGTVNNLANLYCEQGKLFEAREMYEQALGGITRSLGPDHSFISGVVNNRGLLYAEQGELDAAQQMFQQARDGFKRSLGSEHPHTQMVCYNIEQLGLRETRTDVPIGSNVGQENGVDEPRRRWYF
jgi:tetratricopeptide (TPR) repeat protein